MFTLNFWKDATERAVKTFAQFIVVLGAAGSMNVFEVDWQQTLGLALGGLILSYATSIVSAGVGNKGTASLVE